MRIPPEWPSFIWLRIAGKVSLSTAVAWFCLPWIVWIWGGIFAFWIPLLPQLQSVSLLPETVIGREVNLPSVMSIALAPSGGLVLFAACATSILWATIWNARRTVYFSAVPLRAFLYVVCGIQMLACGFSLAEPIPWDSGHYTLTSLRYELYLLLILPTGLGCTCYVFDRSWIQDLALTFLMYAFLIVFPPLQLLTQCVLLHEFSTLFLPLLLLIFGSTLQVAALIALYGYGMSWR